MSLVFPGACGMCPATLTPVTVASSGVPALVLCKLKEDRSFCIASESVVAEQMLVNHLIASQLGESLGSWHCIYFDR